MQLTTIIKGAAGPLLVVATLACGDGPGPNPTATAIAAFGGTDQSGTPGIPLADPLSVRVTDATGNPVLGVSVTWAVLDGGGTITPTPSSTNSQGVATTQFTLGPTQGEQHAQASVEGLTGSPVLFTATATAGGNVTLSVLAGGNNVPERYSSDLWVHGNYAYTGTWGSFPRNTAAGDVIKIWLLGASGAPTLADSVEIPDISTVSDVQVSDDGQVLVATAEFDPEGGVFVYSLADPVNPALLDHAVVTGGVHTGTIADIDGGRYVFAARNPGADGPALLIFDITNPSAASLIATVPVPANYGIHDTYVRDGIAFVFAWNTGVIIYDVGNGISGGAPNHPVEVSRLITDDNGVEGGPSVHNGWWFHNPVSGENRYLFIGQEGQGVIGSASSGDIHVVDVSDLRNPREVAFFHLNGAGTHNFWMDEARQILYAAYYNAGVVALDVSGTLSGNLSSRLRSQILPGGNGNTFTWGVQLANGYLYASDMLSGFWQLKTE